MIQPSKFSSSDLMISPGVSVTFENVTYPIPGTPEIYSDIDINEENSVYCFRQNMIDYIENIYIFKNSKEIKMFLISNDDLIQILLGAQEHIYKVFGQVPIYLELYHDPEEEWDELFILIKTQHSPEEAVNLENQLFEEWFASILDKVSGRLNFTEEPL
ncbi:hypothetical protein DESAMIL20_1208 [Desulfurella amilsii]|uniref:Uncharacterized protein n=1 Tax=Desulfurella amilsii TaxID=1562698 RepID=A0A1X4XVW0_9BACT|nr:hypothetical protein [Desulfurella amilsii]OSS41655.1 hypothetical protein DESAMIL20_1208 [Desulfurella amilsii]